MDNFQWTEDNLYEFMNSLWSDDKFDKESFKKELDFFIKSMYIDKQKDYEILERFSYYKRACYGDIAPIKSVKRLSDNEIFTVDDRVSYGKYCNIIKLFVSSNGFMWCDLKYDNENVQCNVNIAVLDKVKHPVFTTENGVDIYEGMQYWYLNATASDSWELQTKLAKNIGLNNHYIRFSTKEAAEEYILFNKPILSLNDILNSWSDENNPNYYKTAPLFKRFLKAAKEKL